MSLKSTGFVAGLPSGESGKTSEVVGGPLNMDATGEIMGLHVAVTVGNPDHIQSRDTFTPSASRRRTSSRAMSMRKPSTKRIVVASGSTSGGAASFTLPFRMSSWSDTAPASTQGR